MTDSDIARVLSQDLSADCERFREELLARCLKALEADESDERLLDDEVLESIAGGTTREDRSAQPSATSRR